MNASDRAERREQAGLPVLLCPNCGKPEAHWYTPGLDEWLNGQRPGFVCT